MSVHSNNQVQQRGLLTPIVKTLKMDLFSLRIDQLVFDATQSVKMRSVQFREIMVHYNNQVDFLWNLKGKLEMDLRHVLLKEKIINCYFVLEIGEFLLEGLFEFGEKNFVDLVLVKFLHYKIDKKLRHRELNPGLPRDRREY